MADEHKTEEPNGGQKSGDGTGTSKTFTQEELDRIIAQRLAREKEKISELDSIKSEYEKLLKEKEEREKAEMTELERAKKELEELNEKYGQAEKEKQQYEERLKSWETKQLERIEKEMEGLSDSQKAIVNALPLEQRLDAINEFKTASPKAGEWGKGGKPLTDEEQYRAELMKAKTLAEREKIVQKYMRSK